MKLTTVLGWLWGCRYSALIAAALALTAGELYLRTPVGRQLEFVADDELGMVYKPGQRSALVRINADGHRGPETDWSRRVVLALGDSQAFGWGMGEGESWTDHLARQLGRDGAPQVVNAAHPGFGPYHQSVRLRRVLQRHPRLEAVLVRVSIEDRDFLPPAPGAGAGIGQRAAAYSKLVPFVAGRARKLAPSLTAMLRSTTPGGNSPRDEAAGERMWERHHKYWDDMIAAASAEGVPVVFFVHDPSDLASNRVLEERLAERGGRRCHVVRLGSPQWGLRPGDTDRLVAQYRVRYTLQHDEHGNDQHHALVGRALADVLRKRDVLPPAHGLAADLP